LDLLSLKNVTNLTQVSARQLASKISAELAHSEFLAAKISVYWRDYFAVPEGISPDAFIDWACGSSISPPEQIIHLMEKRGSLYYLKDANFEMFLKEHYDPTSQKLVEMKGVIKPWGDIVLFVPLLPLGQLQKEKKINEVTFDDACNQLLANGVFENAQWDHFAHFLINHAANPVYANKGYAPNNVTWVLALRMLRNIVAHEHTSNWAGLKDCLQEVVLFTKSRHNFRLWIHTYELNIV